MNRHLGISVDHMDLNFVLQNNINWIQISNKFSSAKDITSLLKICQNHPLKISYMFPVFNQNNPEMIFFLSNEKRLRDATMEILEENLSMAKSLPTEHVVVNLISPLITDIDKSLIDQTIVELEELAYKYEIPILIHLEDYSLFEGSNIIKDIMDSTSLRLSIDINKFYRFSSINKLNFKVELNSIIQYVKLINITFDVDYLILQDTLNYMYDKISRIPIIIKTRNKNQKQQIYHKVKSIREIVVKEKAFN
ncbi:hypothetical protein [Senegalia massiliensis]|uniref:hypothetical protein n=1 Tax=Senegalia massiliensis TaxID=1720316 RepID=UPI00103154A9|nr:hypothetical protein [Senegalia massiliensis]